MYKEWEDSDGYFYKQWGNETDWFHREDGPAYICYNPDGSIHWEAFYVSGDLHREDGPASIYYYPDGSIKWEYFHIAGKPFGRGKEGFWKFWEVLTEVGRQAPDILKCLARYS
jgi:hypothetical protein